MIAFTNVSKKYAEKHGTVYALNPVSFELKEGKKYAVVGESGSGKTTLCNIMCGLLAPDTGEVFVSDKDIYKQKDRRILYRDLQLVMQNASSSIDPTKKVYDILAEPLKNLTTLNKQQIREKIYDLMVKMQLPHEFLNRKPKELSGGQLKRVSIARAIGVEPKIIVFDEAVSGLDVVVRNDILKLLNDIQKELGCTYFFVTHDIDVALYIADYVFVMKGGNVVEQTRYNSDTSCFKHEYSRLLLQSAGLE